MGIVPSTYSKEKVERTTLFKCEKVLVVAPLSAGGRSPVHLGSLENELIEETFKYPEEGSKIKRFDGKESSWEAVNIKDGWIISEHFAIGTNMA